MMEGPLKHTDIQIIAIMALKTGTITELAAADYVHNTVTT